MAISRYPILALAALTLGIAGCAPLPTTGSGADDDPRQTAPPIATPPPAQQATTPAKPSATPQPPTAEQRRSQLLIAQVEQAYSSGAAHYRKGELSEARIDFDRAVDLMLSSPIDLKQNAQLSDEFERIVDAVNALEMEALKQGNGLAPNVEPSPADVATDVTFDVDPKLLEKARSELATTKSDLPLVINDYVAGYINFFANTQRGHFTLLHSLQRAGRYKAMIQRVMAEEGVPQDLIYLAVAESGFQPQAVNRGSGAGGMWQFMPRGDYGLTRNGYVDERFDPEKSTRAYARYMKFLYNQLGDWYLAMAAYDWGAGNVQRAVQKTGYADFWELYRRNNLPVETKNYVPEILAAIIISRNTTQYGFDDVQTDPSLLTDTVTIHYPVDLRLVGDIVDASEQELLALNPSLLRSFTPPEGSFDLHLPPGTATLFEQRIAEIPEAKRTSWRYHRVIEGDTLASIAREFHVSPSDLAAANQLKESDSLDNMEAVVVPVAPAATASARTVVYRVRKTDTLVTIADRFGVSLDDLRQWNHLAGLHVVPGQRLRVTEPAHLARSRTAPRTAAQTAGKSTATRQAKGKTPTGQPSEKQHGAKQHGAHSTAKSAAPAIKKKPNNPAKKKP